MKKKMILSILICTMLMGSLAGCGKGTSDNSTETEDGKVKLTALIQRGGSGKAVDEIEWLKELEEKTGVEKMCIRDRQRFFLFCGVFPP